MIGLTGKELIFLILEVSMKGNGLMTSKKVGERNTGQ
jgi:hypothetical protein